MTHERDDFSAFHRSTSGDNADEAVVRVGSELIVDWASEMDRLNAIAEALMALVGGPNSKGGRELSRYLSETQLRENFWRHRDIWWSSKAASALGSRRDIPRMRGFIEFTREVGEYLRDQYLRRGGSDRTIEKIDEFLFHEGPNPVRGYRPRNWLRISAHHEREDRRMVNAKIGAS